MGIYGLTYSFYYLQGDPQKWQNVQCILKLAASLLWNILINHEFRPSPLDVLKTFNHCSWVCCSITSYLLLLYTGYPVLLESEQTLNRDAGLFQSVLSPSSCIHWSGVSVTAKIFGIKLLPCAFIFQPCLYQQTYLALYSFLMHSLVRCVCNSKNIWHYTPSSCSHWSAMSVTAKYLALTLLPHAFIGQPCL